MASLLPSRACWRTALAVPLLAGSLFLSARAAAPLSSTSFQVDPGLELTLFAAEPHVVDPVALAFDEFGRCFVLEMRDYPLGLDGRDKPGGTLRLVADTDGDGLVDQSTLFAEGLSFPTSLTPYDGGVFVTAPPEILFLKDTDGDGRADVRRTVVRGFKLGVTDSNANGLRWGLDNHIHGLNGGNGGRVSAAGGDGATVVLAQDDFRFDPVTGRVEATFETGGGYGLAFDDWGRRFTTYNIDHCLHQFLPRRYQRAATHLFPFETTVSISDHGEMARIYPIAAAVTRPNHPEQAGHFSAAGGVGFLGVSGYPGDLSGSLFVCDVVAHVVHRDVLVEDGPGFRATRSPAETNREFFASRDPACRPTGLELGPDGALYVADMQREVIEHPDYIPDKLKRTLSLRAGEDRGRIYRLAPKGWPKPAGITLGRQPATEWVRALGHSNAWWRLTAQRLIVSGRRTDLIPDLRSQALVSPVPLARLHGYWTLQGLGRLESADLLAGLRDPHPGVVENAVEMAVQGAQAGPLEPAISAALLNLARHDHARVRFVAALALGYLPARDPAEVTRALGGIWMRDHAWKWSRVAVLLGLRTGADALLQRFLATPAARNGDAAALEACADLAWVTGRAWNPGKAGAVDAAIAQATTDGVAGAMRRVLFEKLREGLLSTGGNPRAAKPVADALASLEPRLGPTERNAWWQLANQLGLPRSAAQQAGLAEALQRAADRALPSAERVRTIQTLALAEPARARPVLLDLLGGQEPREVQAQAWELLRASRDPAVAEGLLARWRGLAPSLRPEVTKALCDRRSWHEALLTALESGAIATGELNLDLEQRRELLRHATVGIRRRATRFFSDEEYSNRKAVVEEWLARIPAQGNAVDGRASFERLCASCHQVRDVGHAVGPNLTRLSHRSVEDLISNILDPNMALNPAFATVRVERKDGEGLTGILEGETADTLVLRQPSGLRTVVARRDIDRVEYTSKSLMPEGLETGLTPQALRDLVAFLQE
ncbi:MAG: hypothetical protein RJA22_2127 [Verrucomicrobiota bacterium]|jgi:putative membrane-bound dehydrogenase-like protein